MMTAVDLITAKKELAKLQRKLGKELAKGRFKDTVQIQQLRKAIREKKIGVGDITKGMLLSLDMQ